MKRKYRYVYGSRLSRSHIVAYEGLYYMRTICGSVLYFHTGIEATVFRAMPPKSSALCVRCERVLAARIKAGAAS